MTRALVGLTLSLPVVVLAACSGASAPESSWQGRTIVPQQTHAIPISTAPPESKACPTAGAASVECDIEERDDMEPATDSSALSESQIPGYHPADIQHAYSLPHKAGGTIAIVVPYHDAAAASDLAIYRAKFGLPACTTDNGCLRFIAQDGSTQLPPSRAQWAIETSVDVEIASAACPACALLVVEASSDALTDMTSALHQAIAQHPAVVSNSWVVPETAIGSNATIRHDGVAVAAGTGDRASAISWPASDPSVVAVGGTTLQLDDSARGFTETAWSAAGFGCSTLFAKPSWQNTSCAMRAIADVSAVADPATGVAIYCSVPMQQGPRRGSSGWAVYGGTSVATPIVAAAIALANNPAQLSTPRYLYLHQSELNAVGALTAPLQAGLGSPNGTGAF